MALLETMTSIYNGTSEMIRPALMRAMLRKTLRSPIIFDTMIDWLLSEAHSFEAIQVLSRKFPLSDTHFARLKAVFGEFCQKGGDQDENFELSRGAFERAKT